MSKIPGHSIFNNLYLVQNLLVLSCRDVLVFALLSLNQEKLFDWVDSGYLVGTWLRSPLCVVSLDVVHLCRVYSQAQLDSDGTHPVQLRSASRLSVVRPALQLFPQALPLLGKWVAGLVLEELPMRMVLSA